MGRKSPPGGCFAGTKVVCQETTTVMPARWLPHYLCDWHRDTKRNYSHRSSCVYGMKSCLLWPGASICCDILVLEHITRSLERRFSFSTCSPKPFGNCELARMWKIAQIHSLAPNNLSPRRQPPPIEGIPKTHTNIGAKSAQVAWSNPTPAVAVENRLAFLACRQYSGASCSPALFTR
jgi:hypothetical protein